MNNRMTSKSALTSLLIVLFLSSFGPGSNFAGSWNKGAKAAVNTDSKAAPLESNSNVTASARTPVLVELFTSEGCSTCPPADKNLADLVKGQPVAGAEVIALGEHVDYWNRLGWKDPFSSREFTQRQTDYSNVFKLDDLYTPQMIVDGRTQFTGGNLQAALQAIAEAGRSPKAEIDLSIKSSTSRSVSVSVLVKKAAEVSGGGADVMLAITESGLQSNVSRGENAGRQLSHSAVTRKLLRIGSVDHSGFSAEKLVSLAPDWKRENMKAVVFVQERVSLHVIGASSIGLT
ncbi:MAG TPA: DUF1223 domain-containing protein, partial [Blastocatellia bacterium]|nr:DUF1223 domain-containing protein [Blastocatellia bacterium]